MNEEQDPHSQRKKKRRLLDHLLTEAIRTATVVNRRGGRKPFIPLGQWGKKGKHDSFQDQHGREKDVSKKGDLLG